MINIKGGVATVISFPYNIVGEVRTNQQRKPKENAMKKTLMAGIDLHSNNLFCGIVDAAGKRILGRRLPCDLTMMLEVLAPFKSRLCAIAVESTYNWYWLIDGLQDAGYAVRLANPAAMQQYSGLKHTDDHSDAFWLAEMLRLNILPTGTICERGLRSVRDLLRRRLRLVQQRSGMLLSLQSLFARTLGQRLPTNVAKAMDVKGAQEPFNHPADRLISGLDVQLIQELGATIHKIEKMVLGMSRTRPGFLQLRSLPGVGKILGLTILLESGDIKRFAGPGNYASYARCVASQRLSNRKKKGENNSKCGNRYLSWAFVEAAHFSRRYDLDCRAFYDRKAAKTNTMVATKALACKLARATWHILTDQQPYDPGRAFPHRHGHAAVTE